MSNKRKAIPENQFTPADDEYICVNVFVQRRKTLWLFSFFPYGTHKEPPGFFV